MSDTATCAACGERKELCRSCRMDGVQQPRRCKDCLINWLRTREDGINDAYWIRQLAELGDTESLETLSKQGG